MGNRGAARHVLLHCLQYNGDGTLQKTPNRNKGQKRVPVGNHGEEAKQSPHLFEVQSLTF
jgi:hypothetical protein